MGPVFLGVALALFIAFHFYPAFGWKHGWRLWADALDTLVNQRTLLKGPMAATIAIVATFSAGVVFSPFAIPLIRKSLVTRWFIAFFSALIWLGLFFGQLVGGPSMLRAGGICLFFSAGCNFVGILLSRYDGRHQEALRKLSGN
jgi:type IV secretory pathway VirB2 component (pilin)